MFGGGPVDGDDIALALLPLDNDELLALAKEHGLSVTARTSRHKLIDALKEAGIRPQTAQAAPA